MYRIAVNNKPEVNVEVTPKSITINGELMNTDVAKLDGDNYHVINNYRSYRTEVVSFNPAEKTAEIRVNGNTYQVKAKDQFDALLDQLGMGNLNAHKVSDIKAPMPGLVLKVLVAEGDEVKKGDNLFVLEAMKMENIIKAAADAVVKTVKIKPADKVEKGQLLILFK